MKFSISIIIFLSLLSSIVSCKKSWLDEKRDLGLIVPQTLGDMRLLMTDELTMSNDNIAISLISDGDYFLNTDRFNSLRTFIEPNAYTWREDIYESATSLADWNNSYLQVLNANIVLEGLDKLDPNDNRAEWMALKGTAHFYRAKAFYNLAQSFAKPFIASSASIDLGIPLRLSSDVNLPTTRSSVQATYNQITSDLFEAVDHLPISTQYKTDPSKPAAFALLARCYLSMRDYENAGRMADSCLQYYSTLIDYNSLNSAANYPFPSMNAEIIYFGRVDPLYSIFIPNYQNSIDTAVYNAYSSGDLRKVLFFRNHGNGNFAFKGSYYGGPYLFSGVATDEVYLIRAETKARSGDIPGSMNDVNTVMIKRWVTNSFIPFSAADQEEALDIVLTERRKQLLCRGVRWSDLRRLNQENGREVTLSRTVNSATYTLPPNDNRYVLPIPQYVINQTGIPQNPR